MCYNIVVTPKFEDDVNYYKNKKKFTNILDDLDEIMEKLSEGELVGDEIADIKIPENDSVYKVRAVNSNTRQGKSNGYRVIYYVMKEDKTIYLLTVYYKKEDKNIPSKKKIKDIIEKYCMYL